jgi:hypothetical protein
LPTAEYSLSSESQFALRDKAHAVRFRAACGKSRTACRELFRGAAGQKGWLLRAPGNRGFAGRASRRASIQRPLAREPAGNSSPLSAGICGREVTPVLLHPKLRCAAEVPKCCGHRARVWPPQSPHRRPSATLSMPGHATHCRKMRGEVDRRSAQLQSFWLWSLKASLPHSVVIAIPAASAASITFCPSSSRHFPASTARQVAPADRMTSIVLMPMTGTSKRIS